MHVNKLASDYAHIIYTRDVQAGLLEVQSFTCEFKRKIVSLFIGDSQFCVHTGLRDMGLSKIKFGFSKLCQRNVTDASSKPVDKHLYPSRVINRDGKVQIVLDKLSFGKRRRYWRNPLPILLNLKWRWIMIIFALGFMVTWSAFAIVFYIIARYHGDFETHTESDFTPCMNNVNSFTTAFLFSLESQHTIGYGFRYPTSECIEAVFMVYLQFLVGVFVQCLIAGLVVAKLQLGKRTPNAILFSNKACVGKCNDNVCLMVRIGNAGNSELVNAKGVGIVMERQTFGTDEEVLTETFITFVSENGSENLNLLWPVVIHCQILKNQEDFLRKLTNPQSELIIIIEGAMSESGQNLQLRTSYLAHEIEIGKQFVDISPVLIKDETGLDYHYAVDYERFNSMVQDEQWDFDSYLTHNILN